MVDTCVAAQVGHLASRLPGKPLPPHQLGNVGTGGAPLAVAWPPWPPSSRYNKESAMSMVEGRRRRQGQADKCEKARGGGQFLPPPPRHPPPDTAADTFTQPRCRGRAASAVTLSLVRRPFAATVNSRGTEPYGTTRRPRGFEGVKLGVTTMGRYHRLGNMERRAVGRSKRHQAVRETGSGQLRPRLRHICSLCGGGARGGLRHGGIATVPWSAAVSRRPREHPNGRTGVLAGHRSAPVPRSQ